MSTIALFASGRGSNFEAIQAAIESGKLNARIELVLCDQPDALVISKARAKGLRTECVEAPRTAAPEERRYEHEKKILATLEKVSPRFLVLAGYMRLLTPKLIESFRSERGYARIVNIHPSLLPAFPGIAAYRQAFEYGVKSTGVTVHLVENEIDSGPICAQEAFSIEDCRSVEDVEKRGLEVEHRLYPETLKWVLAEAFSIEKRQQRDGSGRFCVRAN